jgi:uncharacterized protein
MKKLFFIVILFLSNYFAFCQDVPKNLGYVSDYEKVFTPEQHSELIRLLTDYERETTIEIAVLTISDYEGDIFDLAQKTAETWGVGKKDVNNGLLIILSKNKKILRSQTGYGLEGYLPDGWLKHTGDSIANKYLSMNKYYEGIITFVNLCKERIDKEGYSEEHNEELIKENKEDESLLSWMINNIPWYVWVLIIVGWLILLIVWPDGALFLLYLVLNSKGGGKSGGFGGGKFGGGGSSSSWK